MSNLRRLICSCSEKTPHLHLLWRFRRRFLETPLVSCIAAASCAHSFVSPSRSNFHRFITELRLHLLEISNFRVLNINWFQKQPNGNDEVFVFLAAEYETPKNSLNQVLVRNVPHDPDESVGELVEHFFLVNHPDHYLTHDQVVYDAKKLSGLATSH